MDGLSKTEAGLKIMSEMFGSNVSDDIARGRPGSPPSS